MRLAFLRRDRGEPLSPIAGYRLPSEAALGAVEAWSRLSSPALVQLKEAFTTRAFGDNCTCARIVSELAWPAETQLGSHHFRL